MKKVFVYLGCALTMLMACHKEAVFHLEEDKEQYIMALDIKVNYADETKAKKTGWENGDKIFIFFADVTTGYLTITYDGSEWGAITLSGITIDDLSESGSTLTAIYLPFGSDAIPSYSTKWTFNCASNTFFLRAQKQSYTLTKLDGIATLSAILNMTEPASKSFIQFFVPDENASGTARLSCNNIHSVGLNSISADGTVRQVSNVDSGEFITGYAATFNGAKGYYFYGSFYPFSNTHRSRYYFVLEKGGNYYDYYKYSYTDLSDGSAIRLPNMRQVGTGFYTKATIGGYTWATTNYGSVKPWEYDSTQYTWPGGNSDAWDENGLTGLSDRGESVPNKDQWDALASGSTRARIMIGGIMGYLVIDNTTGGYLFLSSSGINGSIDGGERSHYWTSTEYTGEEAYQVYFNVWEAPSVSKAGRAKTDRLSIRAVKN